MKVNSKCFVLLFGKIEPSNQLMVEGFLHKIVNRIDNNTHKVRVYKFLGVTFKQLKNIFNIERFFIRAQARKLMKIIRKATNMQDVEEALQKQVITIYINSIYVFKTKVSLFKAYRVYRSYMLIDKLRVIRDIISDPLYEGAFNMPKKEFDQRFKKSFVDTYKEMFELETIDDFFEKL